CFFFSLLSGSISASTSDATVLFDEANRLYEQGKFREAVTGYQRLINRGVRSSAVYFNSGNASFKAGDFGRAIANYRCAQYLAPRDRDIRANLRFARARVPDVSARAAGTWRRWLP